MTIGGGGGGGLATLYHIYSGMYPCGYSCILSECDRGDTSPATPASSASKNARDSLKLATNKKTTKEVSLRAFGARVRFHKIEQVNRQSLGSRSDWGAFSCSPRVQFKVSRLDT